MPPCLPLKTKRRTRKALNFINPAPHGLTAKERQVNKMDVLIAIAKVDKACRSNASTLIIEAALSNLRAVLEPFNDAVAIDASIEIIQGILRELSQESQVYKTLECFKNQLSEQLEEIVNKAFELEDEETEEDEFEDADTSGFSFEELNLEFPETHY